MKSWVDAQLDDPKVARAAFEETFKEYTAAVDAIETAWGIIANAFGGNWDLASPEWRQAAERWRDLYITRRSAASAEAPPLRPREG